MTWLKSLLALFAILIGIILLCLGVIYLEKKAPGKAYDERQKTMRGNAYRLSFLVGMVYYLIVTALLIRQVDGEKWVEPYLLIYFGLELQVIVLHTYCLLTHSALPLSEKPVTVIVGYVFCGIVQLLCIFNRLEDYPFPMTGYGTSFWIHLTSGVLFLYLALMHAVRLLWKEKE